MSQDWRVEPILLLLFAGILFFSVLLIVITVFVPNSERLFEVFSSIVAAFVGAFFLRVNPKSMAAQDVTVKNEEKKEG